MKIERFVQMTHTNKITTCYTENSFTYSKCICKKKKIKKNISCRAINCIYSKKVTKAIKSRANNNLINRNKYIT